VSVAKEATKMKKLETDIWRKVLKWVDDCPTAAKISSFSGQTLHLNISLEEKDLKKGKKNVDNTSRIPGKS
jgi:hypothetical protein|tara:strand:+ start:881 stop:1093 length:213 start_codon:yes stop_codon:yes gene_type:complete